MIQVAVANRCPLMRARIFERIISVFQAKQRHAMGSDGDRPSRTDGQGVDGADRVVRSQCLPEDSASEAAVDGNGLPGDVRRSR